MLTSTVKAAVRLLRTTRMRRGANVRFCALDAGAVSVRVGKEAAISMLRDLEPGRPALLKVYGPACAVLFV